MGEPKKVPENLTTLTGLWLEKDENGEQYLTGRMGLCQVFMVKNPFKRDAKHPDYYLKVSPFKREEVDNSAEVARKLQGYDW